MAFPGLKYRLSNLGNTARSGRRGASRKENMPASWSFTTLDTLRPQPPPQAAPARWDLAWLGSLWLASAWWVDLFACVAWQAAALYACAEEGSAIQRVAPRLLRGWIKREEETAGAGGAIAAAAARGDLDRPISVAQSWWLGALHERFGRAAEEAHLREAGEVLGLARSLTEVGTRGGLSASAFVG